MKKLLILLLSALVLTSCRVLNQSRNAEDARSATEVAAVSTSIAGTLEAAAQTPSAAFTPQPTDTVSIFLEPTATEILPTETPMLTNTPIPVETRASGHFQTRTPNPGYPTPDGRPLAKNWRDWPVLPVVSDTAADIYWYGVQELGTDPHVLSRIGDCHSEPNVFLGVYDSDYYNLSAENQYLKVVIDYFKGSFDTTSYAVHSGMSVSSVLTDIWADPEVCQKGETALDCEIRVHNPSIMFVNLGSNWIKGVDMEVYYEYLSEIVQTLLDHGILPILSSKADNVEGDYGINETTAQVARDFDIPYFNFFTVSQRLANQGLDPEKDGIHLSTEAWNWRNFYALKTLYVVGQKLGIF